MQATLQLEPQSYSVPPSCGIYQTSQCSSDEDRTYGFIHLSPMLFEYGAIPLRHVTGICLSFYNEDDHTLCLTLSRNDMRSLHVCV